LARAIERRPEVADNQELFRRFWEEVVAGGNLALIDELVADDIVDHEEGFPGQPPGKDGVKFFVNTLREAFPDISVKAGVTLGDGNLAAGEATLTGTHTGDFMGVPASNKSFEIDSVDIIRVEDGKVAEHWGVTDTMSLMQQIGAIPE
jgi:steroid delta-isomerase-like uncharacterized protein